VAAPLLVAIGLTAAIASRDFVPPGPTADDPGFGPGADWDVQWEMAAVADASVRQGQVPHWDPYSQFGVPLLANPESFVMHPAWIVGSQWSTRCGLRALYGCQCLLFLLGMAWLGTRLKLPWWLSMAAGLALVCSPEWSDRIVAGHLMFLGVCAWPASLAAVLTALGEDVRTRPWSQVALGAVGGGALALANLGGGHYPTALGLAAVVVLTWAAGAGRRPMLVLAGLLAVPLLAPTAPTALRWVLVTAGYGVVIWGAVRSDQRGAQLRCVAGVALGVLALGAFRIVPEAVVMGLSARPVVPGGGLPGVELLPLHLPWTEPWHGLESYLYYPWPGWLALLLLCLPALARVHGPLAFLTTSFLLLAWTSGRSMQPWELLVLLPGMSAVNYPMRLQWVLPMLAPLGGVAFVYLGIRRRGGARMAMVVGVLLAAVAGAGLCMALGTVYPPGPQGDLVRYSAAGRAVGTVDNAPDDHLSLASAEGRIHPWFGTALAFGPLEQPPAAAGELAWIEGDCDWPPSPGVEVEATLEGWELRAPAGTAVTVAQRDLPGWRCDGGSLTEGWCDDSPEGMQPARRGNRWLRVLVGDGGTARCRWHTPGLGIGVVLQLLALGMVAAVTLRGAREQC